MLFFPRIPGLLLVCLCLSSWLHGAGEEGNVEAQKKKAEESARTFRWICAKGAGEIRDMSGATLDDRGTVTLAPGKTRSGTAVFRFHVPAPLVEGEVVIDWLYVSNAPRAFAAAVSLDGKTYRDLPSKPLKTPYTTYHDLHFPLPRELRRYTTFWLRLSASESSGKEQAVTVGGLMVSCRLDPKIRERRIRQWRIAAVHPWVEADAKQLPVLLTKELSELKLSGPRNDWLTGAFCLASDAPCTVRVEVEAPEALRDHILLRVVGQVPFVDTHQTVWDPLLRREDMPVAKSVLNYDQIKDFPRFTPRPESPVFLWLTVDTRGLESGTWRGAFHLTDEGENRQDVPLIITILKAEIPVENPLYCMTWQWWGREMIPDFLDHGINVAWRDHELAWKLGAKYLIFQFGPSFGGKPIDEKKKKDVEKELERICALTQRLGVPPDRWALNTFDEPSDKSAKQVLAYGKLIKQLRPEVNIWLDPAWGMQADAQQNWTTIDGCLNIIAPITDIWCPYCWHLWDGSGALHFMRSTRKPLWSYEIYGSVSRRPAVGRELLRTGPWLAWKYRLQGFGIFAANDWRVDPWVGRVGKSRNYSFVYPNGPDGRPISSRGFEALRQGVQEYKRLHVLKRLGADPHLLDTLVDVAISPQGVGKSVEVFDSIREQLDRMLVRMQARPPG